MHPSDWTPEFIFSLLKDRWPESFYDLYPGYSKLTRTDRDCFYQSKEQAFQIAQGIISKFQGLPDVIPVYRVIAIRTENQIDLESPGESWSYLKSSALSFGQRELPSDKKKVLLVAEIAKEKIDWTETLKKELIYSVGDYAEDEIHILNQDSLIGLHWELV